MTTCLFSIRTVGPGRGESVARARMALRLGEDNLPSPGIAIAEGAGLWGNDSPGAAGGGRESWVRKWTLGKSRAVRARLPPEPAAGETSLRLRSVHAVGVRRFHSNFGESLVLASAKVWPIRVRGRE